jgi:histidinol dehydrogenase
VRKALRTAASHIAAVARAQLPKDRRVRVAPGVSVEQQVRPLERVGCYVPGGRYPLPSSLLMTVVPARVAGVKEIVVMCPRPEPVVMAAAATAGATRLFRVGGAHAIAALAFGTATIPKVDRIVGPGNKYVVLAKNYVSAEVGIDMQAGPSEILILSSHGRPAWLAADLIAQAEHDPDARALLITWNKTLAASVAREVAAQLPNEGPAEAALARHGAVIVTANRRDAIALANRMAPEHLVVDDEATARAVRHAGAIFIGEHTAQVAGDYAIGSNHVLPTGGAARLRGGLNAADFVRVVSIQRVTRSGLARLAPTVRALALAEGMTAHAQSIAVRQK